MVEDEYAEFVAARWGRLVRSGVLLGCSNAEAEDLAQTTLTRALVNWRKIRRADDPDAYVHRMLVNAFISARRRRWTGERPSEHLPEPGEGRADAFDAVDHRDAIERALVRLPDDQRVAVVLRYYAHLSEAQMAGLLQVRPGTVKSRLSRALSALAADGSLDVLRGGR